MRATEGRDTASPLRGRWALHGGLLITIGLLAASMVQLAGIAWFDLRYPYDLDYGEGIVWQQMINITAGEGYTPLGVFPAIVYHYPPVYHLVVSAMALFFGTDGLATGRAVSLLATLASILLVARFAFGMIPASERLRVRLLAAFLAAGCITTSATIQTWAGYMRVDMLAAALSLVGLALSHGAVRRPGRLLLAAACFVSAVYTKQTSIAAPVAAVAVLWMARPRSAWMLLAWCALMSVGALAILSVATEGEFLRHILLYNINRVHPARALLLPLAFLPQIVGLTIAALGIGAVWLRLRPFAFSECRTIVAADPSAFAAALMLVFLALKTPMLLTVIKSGGNDNYLIEWSFAAATFVGPGVVPLLKTAQEYAEWPRPLLIAMVLVGLPIQAGRSLTRDTDQGTSNVQLAALTQLVDRIAQEPKPVIADDMVLLIRAGRPVLWEPAIAAELGHGGLYDEAAFARKVRRGDFGFFITLGTRGNKLYDERYNPIVAQAMDDAYPHRERYGHLVVHSPAPK